MVNVWNAIIQTLVLGVVFFYTLSTRKMQVSMVRQIKLSLMPSFTLELVQLNVIDSTLGLNTFALQLTNIGSGTALNIEMQPIFLPVLLQRRRKVGEPNLVFRRLGLLRRDDRAVFVHESRSGPQRVDEDYTIDLEDQLTGNQDAFTDFTITFQDIEGDRYQQKIRLSANRCEPNAVVALK